MADFLDDLDSDDSDDELTLPGAVKPMLGSQEVKEVTMPAEAAAAPEGEPRQVPSPPPRPLRWPPPPRTARRRLRGAPRPLAPPTRAAVAAAAADAAAVRA